MKSAEEGQVIAQPVPKALSVISVNFNDRHENAFYITDLQTL